MRQFLIIVCFFISIGTFAQGTQKDYAVNDSMMRSELVKKEFQQQKAIYTTLSPGIRCELWITKLVDCFHSNVLVDGEKAVLSFIYEFISPAAFDSAQKEENARFQKVLEAAERILQQYYDWPPSKVFRYFYTFMTEAEIETYNDIYPEKIR